MEDFQKQFDKAIDSYTNNSQYGLYPVPSHSQTGIGSQQVSFEDLINSSLYVAIQSITLSPAQILSLHSSPVTLIPPKGNNSSNTGINYVYIVEGITARLYYGGTAYTGANNLEFRYTDASGIKVTADLSSTFINSTVNTFVHVAGITTAFTPVFNSPIVVTVPTLNPATGNSKITLIIKYRIIPI